MGSSKKERRSRACMWPVLVGALMALSACRDSGPKGPVMPVEEVQVSLVVDAGFREVLTEQEAAPVESATIAPQAQSGPDSGPLPALVMPPAARVKFEVGSLGSRYELRFAVGFDQAAYEGEHGGRVRFRLRDGDEVLFEETLDFGTQVPREAQVWSRASLPLAGLEAFTIETERLQGTGLPPAAFASLEIVATDFLAREPAGVDAPNVVLIVVDTLRYDRLGCYGNGDGLTPNIDGLAARGTLYETAYAAAPWTWPSTASIFTGLTPAEHGVTSHEACYLADELPTLAESLQRGGWTTGGFSCNPLISASKAFDQGFEQFQAYEWAHADVVVNDSLAWLATMAEWRFLLYVQFIDPHDYRPTAAAEAKWAGKMPEGFTRRRMRGMLAEKVYGREYDEALLKEHNDYLSGLYDASIADVDREVGRIIADIEARGLLDQTLFIVTADHGEEFLDHGLLYHGSQLHRELVGVPLILAGPGVPAGKRVTERVENRFVASTLLTLLDLDAPGGLRGVNLLDSTARQAAAEEASFVSTSQGMWPQASGPHWRGLDIHGVLLGDEFYMWVPEGPDESSAEALFDLSKDPAAQTDIASSRPKRCETLRRRIARWLADGAAVQPKVMGGGDNALEMLRKLGYVDR